MRLLFVSNYFPPEVNAPATRLHEHAQQWVQDGHDVEVMTSVPNFPEGHIYEGFRNRYQRSLVSGIDVMRLPMYVAENKGTLKRTVSYLSFMLSCVLFSRRVRNRPDVVVGTSPQFFAALGAYFVARLHGAPFVLEVRDLWPESIVAVGAIRQNILIRWLEKMEVFLYRKSDHIVVVTDAFKSYISRKGISPERISVIKNGYDLRQLVCPLDPAVLSSMQESLGLKGKFVASYIGTIGMAHGVEILMDAAQRCPDPDILFLAVGSGAERAKLESRQRALQLPNFRLVDKQSKDGVRYLQALSDVSIVHLKASPLFRTVIPSKIFEAMAMKKPVLLGVEGESKEIIESAGSGIAFQPENADALVSAVRRLKEASNECRSMGERGLSCVQREYDREKLARRYWSLLERVTGRNDPEPPSIDARDAQPVLPDTAELIAVD